MYSLALALSMLLVTSQQPNTPLQNVVPGTQNFDAFSNVNSVLGGTNGNNMLQPNLMPNAGIGALSNTGLSGSGLNGMALNGFNSMGAPALGLNGMGFSNINGANLNGIGLINGNAMGLPNVNAMGLNNVNAMGLNNVNAMGLNNVNGLGLNNFNSVGLGGINSIASNGINAMGLNGINNIGLNGLSGSNSLGMNGIGLNNVNMGLNGYNGVGLSGFNGMGLNGFNGMGISSSNSMGLSTMNGIGGINAMTRANFNGMGYNNPTFGGMLPNGMMNPLFAIGAMSQSNGLSIPLVQASANRYTQCQGVMCQLILTGAKYYSCDLVYFGSYLGSQCGPGAVVISDCVGVTCLGFDGTSSYNSCDLRGSGFDGYTCAPGSIQQHPSAPMMASLSPSTCEGITCINGVPMHTYTSCALVSYGFDGKSCGVGYYPIGSCGPNFGNGVCSPGQCCSRQGYCGTSSSYCNTMSLNVSSGAPYNTGGW